MKRILTSLVLGLFITVNVTAIVSAEGNPIWDGLRSGINAATGTSGKTSSSQKGYSYVALGDSVAAGIGLSTQTNTTCKRTSQAYAYTVAKSLGVASSSAHIACSGATAGDLVTKQGVDGPNVTAQLDTAFAKGTPKIMTITAGANDAHWSTFLKKCYVATCGTHADTLAANTLLETMQLKLFYAFNSIQNRSSSTPPKVYITGYYNPLSSSCTTQRLTPVELAWINAETRAINQTIQNITKYYTFATFVPIDFTGHDICSNASWVQGLSAKAPFHPTATGQKAIANAILTKMR